MRVNYLVKISILSFKMDFDDACDTVKDGTFSVSNRQKLMFYGLYKVATNAQMGTKPKDSIGIAKWNAWKEFTDLTAEQAKDAYVILVQKALAKK